MNQLFRDYLDGKIPVRKQPAPMPLAEWQVQALRNIYSGSAFQDFIDPLIAEGIITLPKLREPLPMAPRARALAAKAARGKGPPSLDSWRGRERSNKFRSQ